MDDLQTIKDFIRYGASRFVEAKVGCVSPYNEAYSLIQHVIHLKAIPDKLLDAKLRREEITKIENLFDKRIKTHMPIPYLINKSVFAGKAFYVDERVVIPRSPIQLYIEDEFKCLRFENPPRRILDLCTGCGCIGIATAYVFPTALISLADISEDALNVAQENIIRHKLPEGRIHIIKSDLFENITAKYDLILCNPPYVSDKEMIELKDKLEISKYQPKLGLMGGKDGLDVVKRILAEASKYLTDHGLLVIEIAQYWDPIKFKLKNWRVPLKSCPTVYVMSKEELTE